MDGTGRSIAFYAEVRSANTEDKLARIVWAVWYHQRSFVLIAKAA